MMVNTTAETLAAPLLPEPSLHDPAAPAVRLPAAPLPSEHMAQEDSGSPMPPLDPIPAKKGARGRKGRGKGDDNHGPGARNPASAGRGRGLTPAAAAPALVSAPVPGLTVRVTTPTKKLEGDVPDLRHDNAPTVHIQVPCAVCQTAADLLSLASMLHAG